MDTKGKLYSTVMEKLSFEPRIDSSEITISIKGNSDIVVLGGFVKTYLEKIIAERTVKNIVGVRVVVDELKVDSSLWKVRSDVDIGKAAAFALDWSTSIPKDKVKVTIDEGYLTLSGEVEWQYQKLSAWNAVTGISGVKSVINNIIVKPSLKINASTVKDQIIKEFERNAKIDAEKIQVELFNNSITLKGKVRNFDEMDEAVDVAWSIPGVREVNNDLTII